GRRYYPIASLRLTPRNKPSGKVSTTFYLLQKPSTHWPHKQAMLDKIIDLAKVATK
ncbi:LysR family transcriptional regulator, partial [Lacticaseibacillus rhamnosus MTCC 5462]